MRTEGRILSHGVIKDSASAIFNGIGKIEHGASKVECGAGITRVDVK